MSTCMFPGQGSQIKGMSENLFNQFPELTAKADVTKTTLIQNDLMNVAIANLNSPMQITLSGKQNDIEQAKIACERADAVVIISLKVSDAFHSPFIGIAQKQFEIFLKDLQLSPPAIPLIGNYTAQPYLATNIQKNIAQQITHSVRWTEAIEYLLTQEEREFEEIGPGSALFSLVRGIKNGQ